VAASCGGRPEIVDWVRTQREKWERERETDSERQTEIDRQREGERETDSERQSVLC
jgi:hypothetical protein